MKITNTSSRQIAVPISTETKVLNPNESVAVSDSELASLKSKVQVDSWLHRGMLTVESGEVEPEPEADDEPEMVEIIEHGGGWYTVHVAGIEVSGKVRKAEAEEIAAEYA